MGAEYGVKNLGYLEKGIAAALWYDSKDDSDSVEIRNMIEKQGVEATLRKLANLKDSENEKALVDKVLKQYNSLKQELSSGTNSGTRTPSDSKM